MKIHLFLDHTALLVDDHKPTVTVEPAAAGTLEIEGRVFDVTPAGSPVPVLPDAAGHARVVFTTARGIRYVGIRPRLREGTPYSAVDFVTEYIRMRVHLDDLERQVDRLAAAQRAIIADTRHNALGMLTHNTKKKEV